LRIALSVLFVSMAVALTIPAGAQVKEPLVNEDGVEAPCLGIGVGMALVSKCVSAAEQQGFIKVSELGYSGLTIGTTGADDAKVTAVAAGSPGETAGVKVGDVVVKVNGKAAALTPGTIAYSHLFGEKSQTVAVKTKRAGVESEVKLVRVPAPTPPNTPKGNILLMIKPLIDWHGQFVPCMGAGIAAGASFAWCNSIFKPHGYIEVSNLGATGITMDQERADAAVIKAVDAGSPADKAGIKAGDEVTAIDGAALTASVGQSATEEMFGKSGQSVALTVRRGGGEQTLNLKLGDKPKS
jgi:S1-C subfamily serine protease